MSGRIWFIIQVVLMLMLVTSLTLLVSRLIHEAAKPEMPKYTPEEAALIMQCDERHGLITFARGPYGVWVSCNMERKHLWQVRL